MNAISYPQITSYIYDITPDSLQMMDALGMPPCRDNHLDILRESFRQPECDISLFASLTVSEPINCFDNNNNFFIDLLSAVDNLLFFHLRADNIKPIRKKLSDVFLKKINTLLQFECFLEFYDYLVERVEVVAIVAASACEVHYCQNFLFPALIGNTDPFLPLAQNSLHSAAWLCFED